MKNPTLFYSNMYLINKRYFCVVCLLNDKNYFVSSKTSLTSAIFYEKTKYFLFLRKISTASPIATKQRMYQTEFTQEHDE